MFEVVIGVIIFFGGLRGLEAEQIPLVVVETDNGGDELVEFRTGHVSQRRLELGCSFVGVILAFEQDVSKGESQHGQVDLLMLPNLFKVLGERRGIGACIGRTRGAYMHTIVLVR